jgi:oligopeptide/dipeptide ABC transporter ATP-binding protein
MATADEAPLLSVRDLRVHVVTRRGIGRAVDGVSFDLRRGETMGLVGESGSGKSMTALAIMGLPPRAARVVGGQVRFRGEDLLAKTPRELRRYRGQHLAMVLQDPMTALNPVFTIRSQLGESLRLHQGLRGANLTRRAVELLRLLRIPAPETALGAFPHLFSGGMRQRVVGAIALAGTPEVLIADEPTTSLDATIEAAYLATLREIQQARGLAILYISHDLGVVARVCDRVTVMYAGRVVETAPTDALFARPAHPYTEALLQAVPDVRAGRTERLASIPGQPPSIYALPAGCPFVPRCPVALAACADRFPDAVDVADGHRVSCWRHL